MSNSNNFSGSFSLAKFQDANLKKHTITVNFFHVHPNCHNNSHVFARAKWILKVECAIFYNDSDISWFIQNLLKDNGVHCYGLSGPSIPDDHAYIYMHDGPIEEAMQYVGSIKQEPTSEMQLISQFESLTTLKERHPGLFLDNNAQKCFEETVEVLRFLGHFVFVGDAPHLACDQFYTEGFINGFKNYRYYEDINIRLFRKLESLKDDSNVLGFCFMKPKSSFVAAFKSHVAGLYHEAWHVLQTYHDDYYHLKDGKCAALKYRHTRAGISIFLSSSYHTGTPALEIPAYGVEYDSQFVLASLKQQGLAELWHKNYPDSVIDRSEGLGKWKVEGINLLTALQQAKIPIPKLLWDSASQPWDVPAATKNSPDVISVMKKNAETKLKQQGLFDLIFNKCSFSPLVESYKNGPKDHIYRNFFAYVMKHYIVTKDGLEWTIQVKYLGCNPEPITLLEFCRQNEFVIPKHLL